MAHLWLTRKFFSFVYGFQLVLSEQGSPDAAIIYDYLEHFHPTLHTTTPRN